MKVKTARRWLGRNRWNIAKYKCIEYPPRWFKKQFSTCMYALSRPLRMKKF